VKFFVLLFLLSLSSCSFRLYKASIGSASKSDEFRLIRSDGSEQRICFREDESYNENKCPGGGVESDQQASSLAAWIEFRPTYFGKSNFGLSNFLSYTNTDTYLVDYPQDGEESEYHVTRVAYNPFIFYNWGKRYMRGSGWQFRIGIGASVNYLNRFKIKRISTDETFQIVSQFPIGNSVFFGVEL
jgi:hypothetical protein